MKRKGKGPKRTYQNEDDHADDDVMIYRNN